MSATASPFVLLPVLVICVLLAASFGKFPSAMAFPLTTNETTCYSNFDMWNPNTDLDCWTLQTYRRICLGLSSSLQDVRVNFPTDCVLKNHQLQVEIFSVRHPIHDDHSSPVSIHYPTPPTWTSLTLSASSFHVLGGDDAGLALILPPSNVHVNFSDCILNASGTSRFLAPMTTIMGNSGGGSSEQNVLPFSNHTVAWEYFSVRQNISYTLKNTHIVSQDAAFVVQGLVVENVNITLVNSSVFVVPRHFASPAMLQPNNTSNITQPNNATNSSGNTTFSSPPSGEAHIPPTLIALSRDYPDQEAQSFVPTLESVGAVATVIAHHSTQYVTLTAVGCSADVTVLNNGKKTNHTLRSALSIIHAIVAPNTLHADTLAALATRSKQPALQRDRFEVKNVSVTFSGSGLRCSVAGGHRMETENTTTTRWISVVGGIAALPIGIANFNSSSRSGSNEMPMWDNLEWAHSDAFYADVRISAVGSGMTLEAIGGDGSNVRAAAGGPTVYGGAATLGVMFVASPTRSVDLRNINASFNGHESALTATTSSTAAEMMHITEQLPIENNHMEFKRHFASAVLGVVTLTGRAQNFDIRGVDVTANGHDNHLMASSQSDHQEERSAAALLGVAVRAETFDDDHTMLSLQTIASRITRLHASCSGFGNILKASASAAAAVLGIAGFTPPTAAAAEATETPYLLTLTLDASNFTLVGTVTVVAETIGEGSSGTLLGASIVSGATTAATVRVVDTSFNVVVNNSTGPAPEELANFATLLVRSRPRLILSAPSTTNPYGITHANSYANSLLGVAVSSPYHYSQVNIVDSNFMANVSTTSLHIELDPETIVDVAAYYNNSNTNTTPPPATSYGFRGNALLGATMYTDAAMTGEMWLGVASQHGVSFTAAGEHNSLALSYIRSETMFEEVDYNASCVEKLREIRYVKAHSSAVLGIAMAGAYEPSTTEGRLSVSRVYISANLHHSIVTLLDIPWVDLPLDHPCVLSQPLLNTFTTLNQAVMGLASMTSVRVIRVNVTLGGLFLQVAFRGGGMWAQQPVGSTSTSCGHPICFTPSVTTPPTAALGIASLRGGLFHKYTFRWTAEYPHRTHGPLTLYLLRRGHVTVTNVTSSRDEHQYVDSIPKTDEVIRATKAISGGYGIQPSESDQAHFLQAFPTHYEFPLVGAGSEAFNEWNSPSVPLISSAASSQAITVWQKLLTINNQTCELVVISPPTLPPSPSVPQTTSTMVTTDTMPFSSMSTNTDTMTPQTTDGTDPPPFSTETHTTPQPTYWIPPTSPPTVPPTPSYTPQPTASPPFRTPSPDDSNNNNGGGNLAGVDDAISDKDDKAIQTWVIVVIVVAAVLLIVLIIVVCCFFRAKNNAKREKRNNQHIVPSPQRFDLPHDDHQPSSLPPAPGTSGEEWDRNRGMSSTYCGKGDVEVSSGGGSSTGGWGQGAGQAGDEFNDFDDVACRRVEVRDHQSEERDRSNQREFEQGAVEMQPVMGVPIATASDVDVVHQNGGGDGDKDLPVDVEAVQVETS